MATDPRYVFDTNTLVSAMLVAESPSSIALRYCMKRGYLIVSPQTLAETEEVILRKEFDAYLKRSDRSLFLESLKEVVQTMSPTEQISVCRDSKDDMYLELAIAGRAECMVTGDKDLLALHPFRGISILTPRQFLDKYIQPDD